MTNTPPPERQPYDVLRMPPITPDPSAFEIKAWELARAAIPYLKGVASQHYGYVRYGTLDKYWLAQTGKNIGHPLNRHIGRVLGKVAEICMENDMPMLPALVVNQDEGLAGKGFEYVPFLARRIQNLSNLELHQVAAEMRLECYQRYRPEMHENARWRHTKEYLEFRNKPKQLKIIGPLEGACRACGTELPEYGSCDQEDCPSSR